MMTPDEGAVTMNRINVDRLMEELSAILSEKYGIKITVRAVPKDENPSPAAQKNV